MVQLLVFLKFVLKVSIEFITNMPAAALDSDCMTVSRFILTEQRKHPGATGDLTKLLNALTTAIKACSNAVRKAGFHMLYGLAGSSNTTGDDQKKLDVLSNEMFINVS